MTRDASQGLKVSFFIFPFEAKKFIFFFGGKKTIGPLGCYVLAFPFSFYWTNTPLFTLPFLFITLALCLNSMILPKCFSLSVLINFLNRFNNTFYKMGCRKMPMTLIVYLDISGISPIFVLSLNTHCICDRVNPRLEHYEALNEEILSKSFHCKVDSIDHLKSEGHMFYRLPSDITISSSTLYKEHKVYGIDLSSAATVVALDVSPEHHVLDLCCAPGAKLAMISDTMYIKNGHKEYSGTITGVDISSQRLSICRTICKKYKHKNIRLFLQDATVFKELAPDATLPNVEIDNLVFPDSVAALLDNTPKLPKKIMKKRKRSNNALDNLFYCIDWKLQNSSVHLYDRVILDAQCTLDASVRHLLQHNKLGVISSEQDADGDVTKLQKRLILNAFHLLKEGGYLIYSTCSFCQSQNEDVVMWLLDQVCDYS